MSSDSNAILQNAIQGIFSNHKQAELKTQKKMKSRGNGSGPSQKDLELAMTVLLVDLAGCDQNFDPTEYHIITSGLQRVFGTSKTEVTALVNQANLALANLRGVNRFGKILKENLDDSDRKAIMEIIEDVIAADGEEDGFETYLRHKLSSMLGIDVESSTQQEQQQEE